MDESERQLLRMANGAKLMLQSTPAPVALSRRRTIGFRGKARMYYYPPTNGARVKTPLVLFPYLGISRPYIFDLRPGESFAEHMMAEGIPFYLADWGAFGPEDRDMGMDDVISDMIPSLLEQALDHAKADKATAFGYCMGVPMTTSAIAHNTDLPVKNLLTMVGPIDFSEGEFPMQTQDDKFDVDSIVETFDMMPAEFVQSGFKMLNPMGDAQLMKNMMENMWNAEWLRGFQAMNRWSNEWMPLPKTFFRQWVRCFYQGNELFKGEFKVMGDPVSLSNVKMPLLCVAATNDTIVPTASAKALMDVVGSEDKTFMELPGGHISVIAGRKARNEVWPSVTKWLKEHD